MLAVSLVLDKVFSIDGLSVSTMSLIRKIHLQKRQDFLVQAKNFASMSVSFWGTSSTSKKDIFF